MGGSTVVALTLQAPTAPLARTLASRLGLAQLSLSSVCVVSCPDSTLSKRKESGDD